MLQSGYELLRAISHQGLIEARPLGRLAVRERLHDPLQRADAVHQIKLLVCVLGMAQDRAALPLLIHDVRALLLVCPQSLMRNPYSLQRSYVGTVHMTERPSRYRDLLVQHLLRHDRRLKFFQHRLLLTLPTYEVKLIFRTLMGQLKPKTHRH